jgi:hypothetical protein
MTVRGRIESAEVWAMAKRMATCSCGQLRIACEGDPLKVSLCHCLECQKRTGGPYGIAAFFLKENTDITGESRVYTRIADSGYRVSHHFCEHCGATVFWYPQRMPDRVAVAPGAFADPGFPPPTQSVHEETRHGWVGDVGSRMRVD